MSDISAFTAPEMTGNGVASVDDSTHCTANKVLPLYSTINDTAPSDYLSFEELAAMCAQPSVKKKTLAPALTPYHATSKLKVAAEQAQYHAIVQDHDDDDLIKDEIRVKYNQHRAAFLAFTSASHQQDKAGIVANRWKVVIPLSEPVCLERYTALAVGMTLLNKTDAAQVRAQQVFFAPNKTSDDAPFDHINMLDREPLNGNDDSNFLVKACLEKFAEYQQAKEETAKAAKAKPRSIAHIPNGDGIVGKMVSQYNLRDELESKGYKRCGKILLSPWSSTGNPGVVILERGGKDVCYSHHGATDPLSSLNNDGHALDVVDVLAALEFDGDMGKCIAHYAPLVDPEGQKQRQRENAKAAATPSADNFEDHHQRMTREAKEVAAAIETTGEEKSDLPPFPQDLLALPYGLGEMQTYVFNAMVYPDPAVAGFTAMAVYTAFAQTKLTINSYGGLGFNEYYLLMAPTGFGKESTRKPFERIADLLGEQYGISELPGIQFSAPSSKQGMHDVLQTAGRSQVFLSDEFAHWLQPTSQAGSGGSHKREALGYAMELYTKALTTVHPGGAVTKKYEPVSNPRISLYTTSTAEAMLRAMSADQAESGAYNRFVILPMENKRIPKRYEGLKFSVPARALDPVAWVARQDEGVLEFSAEAWKLFKQIDQDHAEPLRHANNIMAGRLSEQAIKMAGVIALSDERMVIEASDLQTAYNIRFGLYERTAALMAESGAIDGKHVTAQAVEQIQRKLMKSKFVYRSQLPAFSRKFKELPLRDQRTVIEELVEGGCMTLVPGSKSKYVSHLHSDD